MDIEVRRKLTHWIKGIIDYNRFAYALINELKENKESKVKSTITIEGKVYELNITLKEKPSDITITVDVDTEPVLNKIKELKKETGALDLSVNRERIKKFEEEV